MRMDDTFTKSRRWMRVGLLLLVLIPLISTIFFFLYLWLIGYWRE